MTVVEDGDTFGSRTLLGHLDIGYLDFALLLLSLDYIYDEVLELGIDNCTRTLLGENEYLLEMIYNIKRIICKPLLV
jgi:hypothetical protein